MEDLIRQMLAFIGDDPTREGLIDTPKRVVKAWAEHYSGYKEDPEKILNCTFKEGSCDEMVIVKNIEFISHCEHHLELILGHAHVGYIPDGKVVGLSKVARLVDCFAKRLQIQEKFTEQIATAIQAHLKPKGVGVVIEAKHQCMSCRGVKKQQSTMITSSLLGVLRTDQSARAEFLGFIK